MWCISSEEARKWYQARGRTADPSGYPTQPPGATHEIIIPLDQLAYSRLAWFSRSLAESLLPFDECLMWVTLSGVWSSSENMHLFYRLRATYGEHRRLYDAPGHLFLEYERADLTTFIELAILFGWDFHLLCALDYASAFVSHDGFVHLYAGTHDVSEEMSKWLADGGLKFERVSPK